MPTPQPAADLYTTAPPEPDTIYQCDALALLGGMAAGSVDLLLTDMPYGTTACDWDTVVDLEAFWRAAKRVLKPRGAAVMTASQPFTTDLINSNRAWFRYEWVWEKTMPTGYLNANRNPLKAHEDILVFYDALGTFNPQFRRGAAYSATRGAVGGYVRDKTVGGYVTVNEGWRYPTSVLHFASENGLRNTQKPVGLFRELIRTYTRPGDLVCDPFCGSGTTAVAAANTGRRYVCGDLDAGYVKIARRRVSLEFGAATLPVPETEVDLGPLFAAR